MKKLLQYQKTIFLVLLSLYVKGASAQAVLKSGFDRAEYADMLWLQFYGWSDSLAQQPSFDLAKGNYKKILISKEVGLYNKCGVYLRQDGAVVIQLRGTVNKPESWLENFYAGMVPAKGSLQLASDYTFNYKLAEADNAAVHIGWLVGTGFLVRAFLPQLDSLIQKGHNNIMVSGHSQGGALSFLVTSYLHYYYQQKGTAISLKTYASAAPKPGNLYYAYDFGFITKNEMGFRIVNTEDWVPETPFSIQTVADYNLVNPLGDAKTIIKKQKFLVRMFMNNVYGKLDGSTKKAAKKHQKYLGDKLFKMAEKPLPGYQKPVLANTMNYATSGSPIILKADKAYFEKFPFDGKNYFIHHMLKPYTYLLDLYYPASK